MECNTEKRKNKHIQIFIINYALGGKTITLDCESNDTIPTLKKRIQFKEKMPAKQQRLIYAGKILHDCFTLSHYNIQRENTIRLLAAENIPCRILHIQTSSHKIITLNVVPDDTITNIKVQIYTKIKIPIRQQRLFQLFYSNNTSTYNKENELFNTATLTHLNITHESTLHLMIRPVMQQITVHTITDQTIVVHAAFDDTILHIKACISDQIGIPVKQQSLSWNDTILNHEHKSLEEYKIPNKAVLQVIVGKLLNVSVQLIDSGHNEIFKLWIDESITIQHLKHLMERKHGIPSQEQIYVKDALYQTFLRGTTLQLKLAFCESYKNDITKQFVDVVFQKSEDLNQLFLTDIENINKLLREVEHQINTVSSLAMLRSMKSKMSQLKRFEIAGDKALQFFKNKVNKIKQDLFNYECKLNRKMAEIISVTDELCAINYNKLQSLMESICHVILNDKIDVLDKKVAEMDGIYRNHLQIRQYEKTFEQAINKKLWKMEENFNIWDINNVIEWILLIENGYFDCKEYDMFIEKLTEMGGKFKGLELAEIDNKFLLNIMGLTTKKDQLIVRKHIKRIIKNQNEINDESMCGLCIENPINTVMIPCGHQYHCYQCAQKYKDNKCPICRKNIKKTIITYMRGFSK